MHLDMQIRHCSQAASLNSLFIQSRHDEYWIHLAVHIGTWIPDTRLQSERIVGRIVGELNRRGLRVSGPDGDSANLRTCAGTRVPSSSIVSRRNKMPHVTAKSRSVSSHIQSSVSSIGATSSQDTSDHATHTLLLLHRPLHSRGRTRAHARQSTTHGKAPAAILPRAGDTVTDHCDSGLAPQLRGAGDVAVTAFRHVAVD